MSHAWLNPECDVRRGAGLSTNEVAELVGASSVSELCWVDADGGPQVRGVVALVRGGRPALAFTYADELVARDVARSPYVALVLSEPRSTGTAFRPVLLTGRPGLVEDPSGDVFVAELVTQELRRYPPSRLLADSPLLMREHWWYLPRLLVEIDVEAMEPLPPRVAPHDHLLVVADGTAPVVRLAGIRDRPRDGSVEPLALDVAGAPAPSGRAVLFGQDASFPDLELWSQWRYRGVWDPEVLTVAESPARTGLGPAPGLVRRWRRQRELERSCVAAIPQT
jgi:hypothetical protein